MFVISAMPNMFFGYETSAKDAQITMREQALSIGGAYLSLEDFEKTQQDAIITGEAAAYENQGVTIDEIRVSSKFDEEDLCWYIAINSVAHKQDLSEMKPEEVQSLLISNLRHTTRLESSGSQTVLRILFRPLDKDKLMDDLEFDEDARTWAGALYETIYESDALGKYKDKFEACKPSYAGDTGYTGPTESAPGGGGGSAESGGSADNTIDISGFVNPRTKNNHDLAAYAYLKKPTICRYCGGVIRLVPAASVYGSSANRLGMTHEFLYQCQNCNARVGCHKGTTRPLGDVANEILRLKRIEAHQVFDAYWQKMHISRTKAYQWLARELKLSDEDTHIGGFEIDTGQRVIDLCRAKMDKK